MATHFSLYRGDELLGAIDLAAELCDFPWYGGVFTPAPAYAPYEDLFRQELELLGKEEMDAWGEVLARIEGQGLSLVPDGGGTVVTGFLIHIDGLEVRWRT